MSDISLIRGGQNMCSSKLVTIPEVTQTNAIRVEQLVEQYKTAIESGTIPVGHKVATLRSIAQQNDISYDAARSAMTKLEALGYLVRKQGSGTFVTDWKKRSNMTAQKTVALLLDSKVHQFGRFYDQLVSSLQLGGYASSIFTWFAGWGDDEINPVLEQLAQAPPYAIVIQQFCSGHYDKRIDAIARPAGTRVINSFLGTYPRPEGWHAVLASLQQAATLAARHLIDRGHQRIGLLTHHRFIGQPLLSTARKRWNPHTGLILGLGHELRKNHIRHGMRVYYLDRIDPIAGSDPLHPINAALIKQWLMQPNLPTAFIGEDHRMAAILRIANENNIKLPKNFEVVGIGNTPWASFMGFPSVWLREDLAAEHVVNLIKMEDRLYQGVDHQIQIKPQLVLR
jgi:DNA-binding LacI/PurR family transcriptional regulator